MDITQQAGGGHEAYVTQVGDYNTAIFTQGTGDGTYAVVTQEGDSKCATVKQSGWPRQQDHRVASRQQQ